MKLNINSNIFNCKVCNTPETITKGMMNKKFTNFDCMVFLMPDKRNQSFWMYNCIIPLDIVMVEDNIITKINSNCPPCIKSSECEYYEGFGNIILEFPGGLCNKLNINEGDEIKVLF
jgi:uncharacterized membrane protein (UPF0127 family)